MGGVLNPICKQREVIWKTCLDIETVFGIASGERK